MGRAGKELRRQADERNAVRTLRVYCRKCARDVACPQGGTLLSGEREPDTATCYNTEAHQKRHTDGKRPDVKGYTSHDSISRHVQSRRICRDREQAGGFLGLGMGIG